MHHALALVPFLLVLVPLFAFFGPAGTDWAVLLASFLGLVWLLEYVRERIDLGRHRQRIDRLQAFADSLPSGLLDGRGFYSEGRARVRGSFRGAPIQLVLALHETRPKIVFQMRVDHPVARFDLCEPGLPARLLSRHPRLRGEEPTGADLQAEALDRATRFLLCGLRLETVRLGGDGQLVATKDFHASDLEPARLRAVFDGLSRAAGLCARQRVAIRFLSGLSFFYTGGGDVRCPYCHDGIDADGSDLSACVRCRTVHHADCFAEAGGCTLLGCEETGARAHPSHRTPAKVPA